VSKKNPVKKEKTNLKNTKETKNLGYQNSWKETPKEVKKCNKLGHKKVEQKTNFRCVSRVECPKCGYFYLVDSSD